MLVYRRVVLSLPSSHQPFPLSQAGVDSGTQKGYKTPGISRTSIVTSKGFSWDSFFTSIGPLRAYMVHIYKSIELYAERFPFELNMVPHKAPYLRVV